MCLHVCVCVCVLCQTKLVDVREYKSWREDGVAFKLRRDAPYEVPNRTLASGLLYKQVSQEKRDGWLMTITVCYCPLFLCWHCHLYFDSCCKVCVCVCACVRVNTYSTCGKMPLLLGSCSCSLPSPLAR